MSHPTTVQWLVRATVCLAMPALCSAPVRGDEPAVTSGPADERIPDFRAAKVLDSQVLSGPHYELEERVSLEGCRYQFLMDTRWGSLPIDGRNMLEVRIREMYGVDRARELAANPQVLTGLLDTLQETPKGVRILLSEPLEVLRRAPQGVSRLLSSQINTADRRAGSTVRRRLAVDIGCDPETTNPILVKLLDRMALEKGLGQVAGKVGLSVALPGLGLVPLTASFKDIVASKLPSEINAELDQELAKLEVESVTRTRFLENSALTTTRRLLFMHHLRRLKGVGNVSYLVHAAGSARTEADGLAAIEETHMLAKLHATTPIERLASIAPPLAHLADGTQSVVWSLDHLVATRELAGVITACARTQPARSTRLLLSGTISDRAAAACRDGRIEVQVEWGRSGNEQ